VTLGGVWRDRGLGTGGSREDRSVPASRPARPWRHGTRVPGAVRGRETGRGEGDPRGPGRDPEFRVRFAREVAAVRQVSGLFTALVLDADVDSAVPWLATAYVAGPSLAEAVTGDGPMAAGPRWAWRRVWPRACAPSTPRAWSLRPEALERAAVPDGPRVIDFGISRAAGPGKSTVLAAGVGWVTGSPGFMSPEQALGGEIGPPSDIFSLGAVLTFATTGRGPFGRGSRPELAYRLVYGPPDLGEIPAGLRPLVERCLAKDPAQRPNAGEVLDAANDGQPAPGWLPGPPWARSPRVRSPRACSPRPGPPRLPSGRQAAAGGGRCGGGRDVGHARGVGRGQLRAGCRWARAHPPPELAPRAAASPTLTTAPPAPAVPGTRPASAPRSVRRPGGRGRPSSPRWSRQAPRAPAARVFDRLLDHLRDRPAARVIASRFPVTLPVHDRLPVPDGVLVPSPGESPSPTPAPEITVRRRIAKAPWSTLTSNTRTR
jgi:hypothetical protein